MKEDLVVADKNAPIAKAINNKKRRNKKIQDARIEAIQEFYDKCIYHRYGVNDDPGPKDYKTGTTCGNMIGDRIRYILAREDISIKEFAKICGIGRSSFYRFMDTEEPDIPKVTSLYKIIKELPCFLDDFLYSPENYQAWEDAYSGYPLKFKGFLCDYEEFKQDVVFKLSLPAIYEDSEGKKHKMPAQIVDLLSKQIYSAFETADALLAYELEKRQPKGTLEVPEPVVEFVADVDL